MKYAADLRLPALLATLVAASILVPSAHAQSTHSPPPGSAAETHVHVRDWGDRKNSAAPSVVLGAIEPVLEVVGERRFTSLAPGGEADWGDYDGDGDLDLAVATSSTKIYENRGGRTFAPLGANLADAGRGSVDWVDYDRDGDLDLFVMGQVDASTDSTTLYENEGDGTFAPVGTGLPNVSEGGADWGDFDGDGDPDVAIVGVGADGAVTAVFENEGDGDFSRVQAGLEEFTLGPSVEWGDVDGDGDLDLLVTGATSAIGGQTTRIYENEGGGAFTPVDAGLPGVESGAARWADIDGDGDLDLAVAGAGSGERIARIYENGGDGSFASLEAGLTGAVEPALKWGDIDEDGDPDLIIAGIAPDDSRQTTVYLNESGGTFTEADAGLPDVSSASASWGDYDADGDLDLFLIGNTSPGRSARGIFENGLLAVDALEIDDGLNDFEEGTGVDLRFTGVPFGSDVRAVVEKLAGRPSDTTGIDASTVSAYRFGVRLSGDLDYDSTRIALQVDALGGISDPTDVTLYKRDAAGTGSFEALETTVGDNGTPNDISDDTLYASPASYSAFVLASDTQPLPVELARFDARLMGEASVRLTWQTASETGNTGFKIQRKPVGVPSGAWRTVGSREGAGTTSEPQRYRFTDASLPYGADRLAYRLKQIDADGSTRYSEVIRVQRSVDELQLLGTSPNPARQQATLRYAVPETRDVTVRLYDVLGRRVRTVVRRTVDGRQETQIDVGGLASGIYFLRLRAGDQTRTRKLTVVR